MPLQNTFDLDVDFKHKSIINEPTVTQNDEVKFILNVFDDGKEFELSNVSTFTLASVRPDKVSVMSLGKLTGPNQVTFELGSTEIMVPGTVDVAIQLYDAYGRVSTLPFTYKVLKDPVKDYVPSADEPTLIELVLGRGPAILQAAIEITEEATAAEGLRAEAENNRVTTETKRVNAESDRVEHENERVTNESERVESESDRNTAERARIQAEEERQTNTSTAIQNAENATEEATNATESINLVLPNVLNLEYIAPYNATTQYLKNNIVRKDKNSYIALQDTLGDEPTGTTDSPFWGVIAIGGVDGTGTGTVTSVNGIEPVNGNVTLVIPDPDLSDYVTKEETEASQAIDVTFNRGIQVVTVPKGTPVNVLNFPTKTIVNYLPLFDSGLWNLTNAVVKSPNLLEVTSNGSTASFGYLRVPVKPSTTYTLSIVHNGIIGGAYYTADVPAGQAFTDTTNGTVTFTTPSNVTQFEVYCSAKMITGKYTFENVMLNEGSTAQEFVANVKGITNPTITNTTTGDSVTVVGTFHTGEVVDVANKKVTRAKREVVLDGSLAWATNQVEPTFKVVRVLLGKIPVNGDFQIVKYNGKILRKFKDSWVVTGSDGSYVASDAEFTSLSIPNADSGWGPDYNPTVAEIQAFMYGWKMTYLGASNNEPYNGTGTKAWTDMGGTVSFTTVLPTTQVSLTGKWQPYRLIHDLATPVTESLKTIGSLRLASGDNTVELTEGRIVRERVNPYTLPGWGAAIINNPNFTYSLPKNRTIDIIRILKNGIEETKAWVPTSLSNGQYKEYAIAISLYDPTAIYEMDYIPKEPYKVSAYTNAITINYRDTLGGVTEELVNDVMQLDSRLNSQQSVIDEVLRDAPVYAKKKQEALKTAVLQNGWVGDVMYRKDDLGRVTVMGSLQTVGTNTANTIIANIPSGYRPYNTRGVLVNRNNVSPYDAVPLFNITYEGNLTVAFNATLPPVGNVNSALVFEISYVST